MKFILQLLTWWDGQSLGTRLFTWRKGKLVGEDGLGNKYYTYKAKRWVIYNGPIEGSRVSPEWHGWLHHTFDNMPNDNPLPHKAWEKPHQENRTGTDDAYRPKGSILMAKPAKRTDYDAWQPE
ncbi:MAG: NADH:ubiquinone oxidoreductase subunit NDUFA12 [Rhodobacteraceae bacterium]|nr:NADH:ubiquinone oxidoreductase subunit NDUFA12 [Paracoccaceae bacterium]